MAQLHGSLIQSMVSNLLALSHIFRDNKFCTWTPDESISIGFALDRSPIVGVVLNPFTRHLYTTIRGCGAKRTILSDDQYLTPSSSPLPLCPICPLTLGQSVIATSVGEDRGNDLEVKTRTWQRLLSKNGGMIRGLCVFQSTAFGSCAVANGSLDGFWMGGGWEWDMCTRWVIATEAGGMIADGNAPSEDGLPGEINERDLCGQILSAVRPGI
jgi:myo-inositol-1(or 4)-monophosphatase